MKIASRAKASGAIKSTAAGFMCMDAEATESFECYGELKTKGVEEMKRRTPLMLRSRVACLAMEDLKTARRLGFGSHAKSAVMFRTGSDGKKKQLTG